MTVRITVYGKPGCSICAKAKEKLALLGLPYAEKHLANAVRPRHGPIDDEAIDLLAAYMHLGSTLPMLRIDEEYYDYPGAMRRLRDLGFRNNNHVTQPPLA